MVDQHVFGTHAKLLVSCDGRIAKQSLQDVPLLCLACLGHLLVGCLRIRLAPSRFQIHAEKLGARREGVVSPLGRSWGNLELHVGVSSWVYV